jgi:hypothetical protein
LVTTGHPPPKRLMGRRPSRRLELPHHRARAIEELTFFKRIHPEYAFPCIVTDCPSLSGRSRIEPRCIDGWTTVLDPCPPQGPSCIMPSFPFELQRSPWSSWRSPSLPRPRPRVSHPNVGGDHGLPHVVSNYTMGQILYFAVPVSRCIADPRVRNTERIGPGVVVESGGAMLVAVRHGSRLRRHPIRPLI